MSAFNMALPGKVKDLAASFSFWLALATLSAVIVVLLSFSEAVVSSVVKEPMEEEQLSELACEKIEQEVAEFRLVVEDLDEGRANGSEADAQDGEDADDDALDPVDSLVASGGDANEPSKDGVGARVTVLPEEVEALSA